MIHQRGLTFLAHKTLILMINHTHKNELANEILANHRVIPLELVLLATTITYIIHGIFSLKLFLKLDPIQLFVAISIGRLRNSFL